MDEIVNEAKRKTRTSTSVKRRYNSKTYTRIYADLPKELVAEFKYLSQANGDKTSTVFKAALNQYIAEHQPKDDW